MTGKKHVRMFTLTGSLTSELCFLAFFLQQTSVAFITLYKRIKMWDRRDAEMYSCRGCKFSSQYPHWVAHNHL